MLLEKKSIYIVQIKQLIQLLKIFVMLFKKSRRGNNAIA